MLEIKDVIAVVMAKRPIPGRVKTRLVSPAISPEMAAEIAGAMLRCMVRRLDGFSEVILAVAPDECGEQLIDQFGLGSLTTINQGKGDLGERLARIWRSVAMDGPVAFFGMDSPDVSHAALAEIPRALEHKEVALGTTGDGGYWTLAARAYHPQLLENIDWGSESVYDQTLRRAEQAGLSVFALPRWDDVDQSSDLDDLRLRLRPDPAEEMEPALRELAETLDAILSS